MSADLLRQAAKLMRERAEPMAALTPWYRMYGKQITAEHIASWHPAVALAVADWLEEAADAAEGFPRQTGEPFKRALAVARAYLGEAS